MHTMPRSPATALRPAGPTAPVKHTHHPLRRIMTTIALTLVTIAATSWLLAFAAPSPAKAATMIIPGPARATPLSQAPAQIRTVVVAGMPGWQIALIAAGTAVLAAILAVAADRARAARRHAPAPSL